MIHLVSSKASQAQIVDIEKRILAGGGVMHADCESKLLEAGSQQKNIWGAEVELIIKELLDI